MELRPVRAETFDALELKKVERPQSAINTTRALVKCFNKLLWFAAEVEDALDVKGTKITFSSIFDLKILVVSGSASKTSDSTLLELTDPELHDEIRKMSDYVDKLLEQISFSLKSSSPEKRRQS